MELDYEFPENSSEEAPLFLTNVSYVKDLLLGQSLSSHDQGEDQLEELVLRKKSVTQEFYEELEDF